MEKFTKTNAERYIKNNNDAQVAQLGHLNALKQELADNTPYLYYAASLEEFAKPPDYELYVTEHINTLGVPVTWTPDGTGFFYASLSGIDFNNLMLPQISFNGIGQIPIYVFIGGIGGGATAKISLTKDDDYSPCDVYLYCQDNATGLPMRFATALFDVPLYVEFKVLKPEFVAKELPPITYS